MKIWIVNHYASSPARADNTRHVSLAAELVRRGHSVNIFASSFLRRSTTCPSVGSREHVHCEQVAGVEFGWVPTPRYSGNSYGRVWNMLVFAFRVWQLPKHCSGRPDVIYGSTPSLFAALASLAVARRLGVPFVLEIRDIWPQTLIDLGIPRFHPFVVLSAAIERYLYRHADAIVTLMPNATPHLVAHGAAPDRIYWVPNGVDFSLVPPVSPPKPKDELQVMYAGAYGAGNDPGTILDAAAKLRQREEGAIRFRFMGSGTDEATMIAKRTRLGLDNVSLEPQIPKNQVYSVLSEADIMVAPVKYLPVHRFGVSGNKVLDYMAVARPIIHAVRSSNHAVLDAGCGLECAPNDPEALAHAISALASMSPQERWEMGLRGRRYVEQNHDFGRLAVKLESILLGALREPPAHSTSVERLKLRESGNPVQPNA
jgi:glycosyltransferase involved in cell wall biosynthesis